MEMKDIGAYILYSDGRVFKKKWGKFMTGSPNSDGYIQMSINGKLCKLHRLIAEHFIPLPEVIIKPQVNHKNGIKTDNRVENLEWCTQAENMNHAIENGLMRKAKGSKNGWAKLNEDQVREIKDALKDCKRGTQTRLAEKYNVHLSTIHLIKKGRNWGYF